MHSPLESIDFPDPVDLNDFEEFADDSDSIDDDFSSDNAISDDLTDLLAGDDLLEHLPAEHNIDSVDSLVVDDGQVLGLSGGELINTFPSSLDMNEELDSSVSISDTELISDDENLDITNSFVKIVSEDGSGSGVFVDPSNIPGIQESLSGDKLIVTNEHVVRGDIDGEFNVSIGVGDQVVKAHLVYTHQSTDIALLRVDSSELCNVEIAELPLAESVENGEGITQFGYPYGGDLHCDTGNVTSSANDISKILHTATQEPGDSGGPLINEAGEIVGISRATINSQVDDSIIAELGVNRIVIEDMLRLALQKGVL